MDRRVFYLPCATCGTPTSITEVHGWIYGHPFCKEECAAAGRAAGKADERRTADEVLAQTLALVLETGNLVRVSADKAARADSSLRARAGLSSTAAVLAFGTLPGAIAGAVHEASESAYEKDVYEIDRRLRHIVREVMTLEGLGVPAAAHIAEIVTRYGSLTGGSGAAMAGTMTQLWHHLKSAYDGLSAIQAATQGPFR